MCAWFSVCVCVCQAGTPGLSVPFEWRHLETLVLKLCVCVSVCLCNFLSLFFFFLSVCDVCLSLSMCVSIVSHVDLCFLSPSPFLSPLCDSFSLTSSPQTHSHTLKV